MGLFSLRMNPKINLGVNPSLSEFIVARRAAAPAPSILYEKRRACLGLTLNPLNPIYIYIYLYRLAVFAAVPRS